MSKWSFCIITTEGSCTILSQVVASIEREFKNRGGDYEIVIIGNMGFNAKSQSIKQFPFKEEKFHFNLRNFLKNLKKFDVKNAFFGAGWITAKKNFAVSKAIYENVCVMHDYVALIPGWVDGFNSFGYAWDVCMTKVLNLDDSRHRDWMVWDYPGIGPALLPYDRSVNQHMYISGTYFCVKKAFFEKNPLDEKLFWGEAEDVEWSKRVRSKTIFKLNPISSVKYLKLKSLSEAPYCEYWRKNTRLLSSMGFVE